MSIIDSFLYSFAFSPFRAFAISERLACCTSPTPIGDRYPYDPHDQPGRGSRRPDLRPSPRVRPSGSPTRWLCRPRERGLARAPGPSARADGRGLAEADPGEEVGWGRPVAAASPARTASFRALCL